MGESVAEVMPEKLPAIFTNAQLAEIENWDDLSALISNSGVEFGSTAEMGDGFSLLATKDKQQLCGVEFAIVEWQFHRGDHGEFVALKLMTRDGRKFVVVDGSTGIYSQLREYTDRKGKKILHCAKGLVRSDFTYQDRDTGEEKPATTYYLSLEKKS